MGPTRAAEPPKIRPPVASGQQLFPLTFVVVLPFPLAGAGAILVAAGAAFVFASGFAAAFLAISDHSSVSIDHTPATRPERTAGESHPDRAHAHRAFAVIPEGHGLTPTSTVAARRIARCAGLPSHWPSAWV